MVLSDKRRLPYWRKGMFGRVPPASTTGGISFTAPAASLSGTDITITGTTNFDLSAGRFGARFTVNGVDAGWRDGVGAVAGAQSVIVSLTDPAPAGLGAAVGDLIGIDPGYSLTDPAVDKVYASDSGLYITASIVTPTITGFSNPPVVGETGTGVNGTALAKIGATRSVLWLGDGVSLGDTDNSYTIVSGDIGEGITFQNTVDGVSATSAATADVVAGGPPGTPARWYQSGVGMTASQWNDQSGAANHLVQATGANQPDLSAGGGFLSFVAANTDRMVNTWTRLQPLTIGMRLRIDTWTFNRGIWGSKFSGCRAIMSPTTSKSAIFAGSTSGGSTDIGVGSWVSVVWVLDGASSVIRVNGTETTGLNPGTTDMSYLCVGAQSDGGSPSDISVAEVVAYASALDATDRAALITYLNSINPT